MATYDRQALRKTLYEEGYDPADIDAAEAIVFNPAGAASTSRLPFALALLASLGLNLFLVPAVILFALVSWTDYPLIGLLTLVLLPIQLVIALLLRANGGSAKATEVSRGLFWGLGISAIPLGGIALLVGACLGCIALYQ
jgi:hypothetical protein